MVIVSVSRSNTVAKINLDDPDLDREKALRKIFSTSGALFGSVAEIFLPLANLKSLEKTFLASISRIPVSAENFSDKFLASNFGHIFVEKQQIDYLTTYYGQ
jgi:hypothetical protein